MNLTERNALVEDNLGLATHFAKRFQASHMEFSDLVQEAYLGLLNAAKSYDPSRGTKFSTYAHWHIRKTVMDAIHDRNEIIRTPRRRPSILCDGLESLYGMEDGAPPPDEQMDTADMVMALSGVLRRLPPRDGIVLRLRYGINTPQLTLAKVGCILGVTPERVRQIQVAAEEKLRAFADESSILVNYLSEKEND